MDTRAPKLQLFQPPILVTLQTMAKLCFRPCSCAAPISLGLRRRHFTVQLSRLLSGAEGKKVAGPPTAIEAAWARASATPGLLPGQPPPPAGSSPLPIPGDYDLQLVTGFSFSQLVF